jgi:hypothetical protein
LFLYQVDDVLILNCPQFVFADLIVLALLSCRQEFLRPKKCTDLVSAVRWLLLT